MNYKYKDITPRGRDICFFDLEATGLSAYAEILEIGALRVETDSFNIMEEFSMKVKPLHIEMADPEALVVMGYDPEIWEKEAVDRKEALTKFVDFADGCILAAHNLPMDWMWLQRSLEDIGLNPSYVYSGIDTISFAWTTFRKKGINTGLSLNKLSNYFNIDQGEAHRALDDARTAYQVFIKLMELNEEGN